MTEPILEAGEYDPRYGGSEVSRRLEDVVLMATDRFEDLRSAGVLLYDSHVPSGLELLLVKRTYVDLDAKETRRERLIMPEQELELRLRNKFLPGEGVAVRKVRIVQSPICPGLVFSKESVQVIPGISPPEQVLRQVNKPYKEPNQQGLIRVDLPIGSPVEINGVQADSVQEVEDAYNYGDSIIDLTLEIASHISTGEVVSVKG